MCLGRVMKTMRVNLNQAEQQLAIHLALSRHANARKKGKDNLRMGNQADWITDLEGIGGELAACRYFGVYPDTEIDLEELPKFDLVTKKGATVDVKTTKYRNGRLLATLKKQVGDCDIYVLVTGEFPEYELKGWAKAEELLCEKNIGDLGHGKGYILGQEQLRKFV